MPQIHFSLAANNPRRPQLNVIAANGCIYEGDFHRGERHGEGTCTFPGGERYTGSWGNGKMHGEGTLEVKGRVLAGENVQITVHSYYSIKVLDGKSPQHSESTWLYLFWLVCK